MIGAGATVTHGYATGTFSARLIVADNGGAVGTALRTLSAVNAPPVASFTVACNGPTCTFDGSGSSDPDGTIASYEWHLGNGLIRSGYGAHLDFTYRTGTFSPSLIVTDNSGATGDRGPDPERRQCPARRHVHVHLQRTHVHLRRIGFIGPGWDHYALRLVFRGWGGGVLQWRDRESHVRPRRHLHGHAGCHGRRQHRIPEPARQRRRGQCATGRVVHVGVQRTHVQLQRVRVFGSRRHDRELRLDLRGRDDRFRCDGEPHVRGGRHLHGDAHRHGQRRVPRARPSTSSPSMRRRWRRSRPRAADSRAASTRPGRRIPTARSRATPGPSATERPAPVRP